MWDVSLIFSLEKGIFFCFYRRLQEMQETQAKAAELTTMAEGKHHIGDFLPPDELARFMEKVC